MEYTCTDFTVNGKCSNCGQCCSNMLPMSNREVKRIKAYVKQHGIKEQRHNFPVSNSYDMTCPFRDEANRKCLVYEVRPAICRQFVCNHKHEDIMNAKINFHESYQVVFMRHEFFGSKEDTEFMQNLTAGVIGDMTGG